MSKELVVCKFGGTSVANAWRIREVGNIVWGDPRRKLVVVSAPAGVTNLLHEAYENREKISIVESIFDKIRQIFEEITKGLGFGSAMQEFINNRLNEFENDIVNSIALTKDYFVSRGEFLNAFIIADYLGYTFVDAQDVIFFDTQSEFTRPKINWELTNRMADQVLVTNVRNGVVMGGFYGTLPEYGVKTLPRGGSDETATIVSKVLDAAVCEIWTDVPGLHTTDPNIVPEAKYVPYITYEEMRELGYTGAKVLHPDAIPHVNSANIPVNIRNTTIPKHPGTMIVTEKKPNGNVVTGIAGRPNFVLCTLKKIGIHEQKGALRKFAEIFENCGVSIEHMPDTIDSMTAVLSGDGLRGEDVLENIIKQTMETFDVDSDNISIENHIALIAVVGNGMAETPAIAGRIFTAIGNAGITDKFINKGSSKINILFGVANRDYETAVKAVYNEFFGPKAESSWLVVLFKNGTEDAVINFSDKTEAINFKDDALANGGYDKVYLCKVVD